MKTECSKCGVKIDSEDKFCGICGTAAGNALEHKAYAPAETVSGNGDNGINYFCVSTGKLAVMSVATLGVYQLYWFYKNWRAIEEQGKEDISPVWRTIFGVLYSYGLFKRVRKTAKEQGYASDFNPTLLFLLYFTLNASGQCSSDICLVIYLLAFLPLMQAQQAVNFINGKNDPAALETSSKYSFTEKVLAVIGGAMVTLAMIGLFAV